MMKNYWLPRVYAACFGGCAALLALYPQAVIESATQACGLWANKVMPALFPFLVISQLLTACLPGDLFTVPLSMLGGSPAGARLISLSGADKSKAQRLSALCATVSPLYVVGTLGGDYRLLLSHWLGAFTAWVMVCVRQFFLKRKALPSPDGATKPESDANPNELNIPQAIADSALAMLSVCGCMVLFSVLSALLVLVVPLSKPLSAALLSVLEMAGGCEKILSLSMPPDKAAPILCAAISFGGLSVFMQNAAFQKQKGVNLRVQLFAKVIHAAAAYAICALFYLS